MVRITQTVLFSLVGTGFALPLAGVLSAAGVSFPTALTMVLAVAGASLLGWPARLPFSVRGSVVVGWLFLPPVIFLMAMDDLASPLVTEDWVCGTGAASLYLLAMAAVLFGPPTVAGFAYQLAFHSTARRVLGGIATVAVASAVALAAAVPSGDRIPKDTYIASLPVIDELRPPLLDPRFGPFQVVQAFDGTSVALAFETPRGNRRSFYFHAPHPSSTEGGPVVHRRLLGVKGSAVELRYDATLDVFVLRQDGGSTYAVADGAFVTITPRDLRGRLAVPEGWAMQSWIGGLVGALILLLGWLLGRPPRWLRRARPAIVGEDFQTLRYSDGLHPVHGISRRFLAPGPALVREEPGLPSYRGDYQTGPVDAVEGSFGSVRRATAIRGAGFFALALVVALLSAAQLMAGLLVLG
ncbi:MAG: hypothetical protein AAGF12_31665 [Myxococcota bacterium]